MNKHSSNIGWFTLGVAGLLVLVGALMIVADVRAGRDALYAPVAVPVAGATGDLTYQLGAADGPSWWPRACFGLSWQVDGIQALYVDGEGAPGAGTRQACGYPVRVAFTVETADGTTHHETNIPGVVTNPAPFMALAAGLLLLAVAGGVRLSRRAAPVTAWLAGVRWGFVGRQAALLALLFGTRLFMLLNVEHAFQYESAVWLVDETAMGYDYACEQRPAFCDADLPGSSSAAFLRETYHTRRGPLAFVSGYVGGYLSLFSLDTRYTADNLAPFLTVVIQTTHALTDTLIAFLVMLVLRQMRFPEWVGVVFALLYATFTPILLESAAVLRDPVSKFVFTVALAGYVLALTAHRERALWGGGTLLVATGAAVVLGFTTPAHRLVIWVLLAASTLALLLTPQRAGAPAAYGLALIVRGRPVRLATTLVAQGVLVVATVLFLREQAYVLADRVNEPTDRALSLVMWGTADGGASVSTVVTCETIWCHLHEAAVSGIPLSEQIARNPQLFAVRYLHSIYGNLTSTSNVYQETLLGLSPWAMNVQQGVVVVFGLLGVGWMLGHWRRYLPYLVLFGLPTAFYTAIFSINGIESRRMTIVLQVLLLATAVYGYSLWAVYRGRRRALVWVGGSGLLLLAVWRFPLGLLVAVLPLETAVLTWIVAFIASLVLVFVAHVWAWLPADATRFNPYLPAAAFVLATVLFAVGQYQERFTKYEWRYTLRDTIYQTITGVDPATGHTLLIDMNSSADTAKIEVVVNGERVKAAGERMPFHTAQPLIFDHVTTYTYDPYRSWYTLALPADFLATHAADGTLTVAITASEPVTMYGNYLFANGDYYGPTFDPHIYQAFIFLLDNSYDARLPRRYDVGNLTSRRTADGDDGRTTDLAPSLGLQSGVYRVAVWPFAP